MTMKRRLFSLFLMLIMMFSVGMTASAVYRPETGMPTINGIRSSAYLDGYSVGIEARGNGKIAVAMTVEARSKMEKLGVHEVEIEQKINGKWTYYDSQYGAEHPEFYDYNTWDYVGTTYFQGTPGVSYRADSLCAKQQRLRHRVYHFLYCGLQVNTKYTKEAGSLCHGRGFLLVNFMTALSDIHPCFSPWVRTPKPLTSISSSTGIVR